ncbi:UNVERIFIED_CONTAM: hypothetical protein Sindi_2005600 [Sesamum indicum]
MLRGVENKHRSGDSRIGKPFELLLNPWAGKRQPGELKHLSSQRKRKQKRFRSSGERNGSSLNRENGVVGEQYKRRAARRSSLESCTLDGRKSSSRKHH